MRRTWRGMSQVRFLMPNVTVTGIRFSRVTLYYLFLCLPILLDSELYHWLLPPFLLKKLKPLFSIIISCQGKLKEINVLQMHWPHNCANTNLSSLQQNSVSHKRLLAKGQLWNLGMKSRGILKLTPSYKTTPTTADYSQSRGDKLPNCYNLQISHEC